MILALTTYRPKLSPPKFCVRPWGVPAPPPTWLRQCSISMKLAANIHTVSGQCWGVQGLKGQGRQWWSQKSCEL